MFRCVVWREGASMLKTYTVSFFGHREIDNLPVVEQRLETIIRKLLREQEYIEFLLGRNGEFDQIAASTVRRLKKNFRDDNSSLSLILPYMTAEVRDNVESFESYYDSIEVSGAASGAHFKSAMQARNREMVDRSDLVVCYIERKSGGAYQTMRYAHKQEKKIINIADEDNVNQT